MKAKAQTKADAEAVVSKHRPIVSAMLAPKSIALIGASEKPGSVGHALLENLQSFRGRVFPINPNHARLLGQKAFPTIRDTPQEVDLAVIATPAATVPGIVAECAAAGVKGAVIISAGFKECGPAGAELEEQILKRRGKMRIIGPNCVGVMLPHIGLNATFAKAFGAARQHWIHQPKRRAMHGDSRLEPLESNSGSAPSFPSALWPM